MTTFLMVLVSVLTVVSLVTTFLTGLFLGYHLRQAWGTEIDEIIKTEIQTNEKDKGPVATPFGLASLSDDVED